MDDIEKAAVGAFMQLVLKLNEATFRPLFMRLVDWTTPGDLEEARVSEAARQLTFFKILDRLLLQLKVSIALMQKIPLIASANGSHLRALQCHTMA